MVVKLKGKQEAKNKKVVTQPIWSQGNVSLEKGGLMELLKQCQIWHENEKYEQSIAVKNFFNR